MGTAYPAHRSAPDPARRFPRLRHHQRQPRGRPQRWEELKLLSPLARAFTVHRIGRRVGLERGITVRDLANDYAGVLESEFVPPPRELLGPDPVLGAGTSRRLRPAPGRLPEQGLGERGTLVLL